MHIASVCLKSLLLASAALPCLAGDPAPNDTVFVAAGTTPGGYVTITNAFWIDRYEVTNQEMADV